MGQQQPLIANAAQGRLAQISRHQALLAILMMFLALCLVYNVTVPLGEAPDELAHFQFIKYILRTHRLPQTAGERAAAGYKGHEPPLYHLIGAIATAWVDTSDSPTLKLLDPNLYPRHSIPTEVLIEHAVMHTADEDLPYRGTVLSWHLIRLLSTIFGIATITTTYAIARCLYPDEPWVAAGAAAVNAFIPQFIYISAMINNDNLAIALTSLILLVMVRILREKRRFLDYVVLGILLGLTRLTKFYTLILLPLALVVIVVAFFRRRALRDLVIGGLCTIVLSIVIAGPWLSYIRPLSERTPGSSELPSFLLWLDVVHMERWFTSVGEGTAGTGLAAFPGAIISFFQHEPARWATLLFKSFWAFYGPMTVQAGTWVYIMAALLCALSLVGLLVRAYRHIQRPGPRDRDLALLLLVLQFLAFLGVEAMFYGVMTRLPDTAQGRHLFPAISGFAILLFVGLWEWTGQKQAAYLTAGIGGALCLLSLICLPAFLLPAYGPSLPVRTTPFPVSMIQHPCRVEFEGGLTLLGYSISGEAHPGRGLGITLYWHSSATMNYDVVTQITLVNGGVGYATSAQQMAEGRYPTSAWDAGDYVQDIHMLLLPPNLSGGMYLIVLSLWNADNAQLVFARPMQEAGPVSHVIIGSLEVEGETGGHREGQRLNLDVGRGLTLCGYSLRGGRVNRDNYTELHYRDSLMIQLEWAGTMESMSLQSVHLELRNDGDEGCRWTPWIELPLLWGNESGYSQHVFLVDYRAQSGVYYGVVTLEDGQEHRLPLVVVVETRPRGFTVPPMDHMIDTAFEQSIGLLGFDVTGPRQSDEALLFIARPSETVHLTLYWRAQARIFGHYTVFTHLLDSEDRIRGQHDKLPRDGYSTLFWAPGEVVKDEYTLTIAPDTPPGPLYLEVGLYQRLTGDRLYVVNERGERLDSRAILGVGLVVAP